MAKTLTELDQALDDLAQQMPQLLQDNSPDCQMEAFAGIADGIQEAAPPEHKDHVWSRMQCILRDAGLIPGDDDPCSDS